MWTVLAKPQTFAAFICSLRLIQGDGHLIIDCAHQQTSNAKIRARSLNYSYSDARAALRGRPFTRARLRRSDSTLKWFAGVTVGGMFWWHAPETGREHKGTQIVHARKQSLVCSPFGKVLGARVKALCRLKLEVPDKSHSATQPLQSWRSRGDGTP